MTPVTPALKRIDHNMFAHADPQPNVDGIIDMAPRLNAMFDYASENPEVEQIDMRGEFPVGSTVRLQADSQTVLGDAWLHALEGFEGEAVVDVEAPSSRIQGIIKVIAGDIVDNGVSINAWRGQFDGFEVQHCRRHGIDVVFGISASLGTVRVEDCGSAAGIPGNHWAKQAVFFDQRTDSTTAAIVTQRTTVRVVAEEAGNLAPGDLVFESDTPYVITEIQTVEDGEYPGHYISVFPRILNPDTEGVLVLSHGAAINAGSPNCSGLTASAVSVQRCGVGIKASGLYGGNYGSLVVEASGVGMQIGGDPNGLHRGTHVGQAHFEGVAAHLVKTTRTPAPVEISAMAVWDASKLFGLSPNDTTGPTSWGWRDLDGIRLGWRGVYQTQLSAPRNVVHENPTILSNAPPRNKGSVRRTNPAFVMDWDDDANRAFGFQHIDVFLCGSDPFGGPGTVTLTVPANSGYTLNGQPSLVFTKQHPVRMMAVFSTEHQDWEIYLTDAYEAVP